MPPLYKVLVKLFDLISGIVSLLDLTTDLMILITWYNDEKTVFFTISLCILILAQLSYLILFYGSHGDKSRDGVCFTILSVICSVPFTPFLSFIFYWVSLDGSCLRSIIDDWLLCYNFKWYHFSPDSSLSPKQQYLEEQVYKHLGFLLQATIEAFPQSLLQLTFIVYYNHPTALSIFSILTSMTSVCSKLFIMVWAGIGLNGNKNRIFFWLCFVVDFFTIFFITSFAFYVPHNIALLPYFTTFRNICMYQFIIGVLPVAIITSVGIYLYFAKRVIQTQNEHICIKILLPLFMLFIMGISLFVVLLLLEIFCVLYVGYVVLYFNTISRLPDEEHIKAFYLRYIEWIVKEPHDIFDIDNEIIISRKQDRINRICIINHVLLKRHKIHKSHNIQSNRFGNYYDSELHDYLEKERINQFTNVTLKSLRLKCTHLSEEELNWGFGPRHSEFLGAFYHHLYGCWLKKYSKDDNIIGVITAGLLTYIFFPIYLMSKSITLCLPYIIVLYLYIDGVNMFVDVDIFQLIMWCAYVLLLLLWSSLLFYIVKDDYYLWHLLPSTQYFSDFDTSIASEKGVAIGRYHVVRKEINDYYFEITMYPIVERIIYQQFGDDICCVIMLYYNAIKENSEQCIVETEKSNPLLSN